MSALAGRSDLTEIVDADGVDGRQANPRQSVKVVHATARVEKDTGFAACRLGIAQHLTRAVDCERDAVKTAERSQIGHGSSGVKKSVSLIRASEGIADYLPGVINGVRFALRAAQGT